MNMSKISQWGVGLFILLAFCSVIYWMIEKKAGNPTPTPPGATAPAPIVVEPHTETVAHNSPTSTEPWYDPTEPDNMNPSFFDGSTYPVSPDKTTTIKTDYWKESARFFYAASFKDTPSKYLYRFNGVGTWKTGPLAPGQTDVDYGKTIEMKSLDGTSLVRVLWIRMDQRCRSTTKPSDNR